MSLFWCWRIYQAKKVFSYFHILEIISSRVPCLYAPLMVFQLFAKRSTLLRGFIQKNGDSRGRKLGFLSLEQFDSLAELEESPKFSSSEASIVILLLLIRLLWLWRRPTASGWTTGQWAAVVPEFTFHRVKHKVKMQRKFAFFTFFFQTCCCINQIVQDLLCYMGSIRARVIA